VSPPPTYAIFVEVDTRFDDASDEIAAILERRNFRRRSENLYFGGGEANAVTCVLAAMDLARSLPWFVSAVRDIRMLRIEELNDLMPALQQANQ
jgi:virulence-associated protein VapD